ncbi:hypothetical protein [Kineococcus sp. SYSU DK003]|uniref:hypothetical protein n=1 Tax=Kineococcus sp. SYSU DK003 TaxID=3383124 RepID=UPI003D7C8B9D
MDLAWDTLAHDLTAGGWSHPHQQAAVLTTTARAPGNGRLPATVAVVFMWRATTPTGEPIDRRLATVSLTRGSGQWVVSTIEAQAPGS